MPFKSQAQRGFMYIHHPKLAKEFEEATPKGKKLPEHLADGGFPEPQEVDQVGMKDATVPDFLLPYLMGKLPFLKGQAPVGQKVASTIESQQPSLEAAGLRDLWARAAIEQSGTPAKVVAPYVRPDVFQKMAHGGEVHPMEKRGMEEEAGNYADGGEIQNPLLASLGIGAQGLRALMAAPNKAEIARSMIGSTGMEPMSTLANLGPDLSTSAPTPSMGLPPAPPPVSDMPMPATSAPALGGVMKSISQTPDTNYDFYKNMSAADREALFQKLQAQKSSAGNLLSQGVAGIGDALARSYGGQNTNFMQGARDITEKNQEARLGAMDTQRQQKMQDMQANIEMQMSDPNSRIAKSMQQTLRSAGLNVPSGMPPKVMLQVAGPLGELAFKQAQIAETQQYHKAAMSEQAAERGRKEEEFRVGHPILNAFDRMTGGEAEKAIPQAIPEPGQTFNGSKVKSVRQVK